MTDLDTNRSGFLRWLGLAASGLGIVMMAGVIAGFSSEAFKDGATASSVDYAILAVMVALTIALLYGAVRLGRPLLGAAAGAPRRERLSRNVLIACGVLGGLIGLTLSMTADVEGAPSFEMFVNGPVAPGLAIAMAVLLLVVLPAISIYWHRIVDEHEREAYRDGAVAAAYSFLTLAPAWWFLWRGGLLPAPNGVAVYFLFNAVFLIVWFWKKYR